MSGIQKMRKREIQEEDKSFANLGVDGRLYLPTHPKRGPKTSPPDLFFHLLTQPIIY